MDILDNIFTIVLMTVSFAALAFVLAFIVSSTVTANQRATEERLKELTKNDDSELALVKNESKAELRRQMRKKKKRGNSFFEKFGTAIFKELQSAEIEMRPEEFVTIWLLVAVVPGSLVALFTSKTAIAMVLLVIGMIIPPFIVKRKQKSRVKAFEAQLGDALVVCCNCLRSGLSFQQAMETLSQDVDAPLGTEFGRCLSEMNLGMSMDEALESMNDRIKSPDLSLMISAVLVQRQTGGNLSEILEMISDKIKERSKMRKEVKAITSQGKMSGMMVGVMPIAILGMFSLMNFSFVKPLFVETRGHIALLVAAGLEAVAFAVINKMVNIKM